MSRRTDLHMFETCPVASWALSLLERAGLVLHCFLRCKQHKTKKIAHDRGGLGQRALPGGRDHYDGPGVDQVRVKQSPPPAAVQVGAFDHVRVRVDPEHQPAIGVHCQTLWTDQICEETIQKALSSFKTPPAVIIEIKEWKSVLLLVLTRISGSAPGDTEALLIVLADKSVQ